MNKKIFVILGMVALLAAVGAGCGKAPEQPQSQIDRAKEFFQFLSDKKIDEALAMMDAGESTKQAWGVNFNTIQSLELKKIEPVYEDEWTSARQIFRAELEVKVTSEGEGYGWSQGQNTRWLSLEKNNEVWQVHELANNP